MLNKKEHDPTHVNMEGITTCLMSNNFTQDWIIDSGATHHTITDNHSLTKSQVLDKSHKNQVHLPIGEKVDISHIGETSLFDNRSVKNVLHVPDFKFSLLSVSKITRKLSCFVSFYPDLCVFQDLFSGKVKVIGKEHGGLYMFRGKVPAQYKQKASCQGKVITAGAILTDVDMWHKRLGHPSTQVLKVLKLVHNNKDSEVLYRCSICPLAKQTRLVFPISSSRSSASFVVVHMDVWGPYKVPTMDKKHYFLTIVDDYSRFVWTCLLQLKYEIVIVIKSFLLMVKTQFDSHVKVVRSDNGTEFFNSQCTKLFQELGILHQSICPYIPQQNGVVERKHRHILNMARAIRFQSQLPIRF